MEKAVDEPTDMTRWAVGLIAAGSIGILGFLARWVFSGVFARLDKVVDEMKGIASVVNSQGQQLAVLAERIGQLKQENDAQEKRIDALANHWRAEFERHRETVHERMAEATKVMLEAVRKS